MRIVLITVAALLAAASPAAAQPTRSETIGAQIDRAAQAYERGDCSEVLAAIGLLPDPDRDLAFDGLSQYRWGFCIGLLGRGDAKVHYRAAADLLGKEIESPSARLEAFFYRVNALLNLDLRDPARTTALEAVERWKTGRLTASADEPAAWFQLGKLFVDAGLPDDALEHYGRALDVAAQGRSPLRPAYLERIADLATDRGNMVLSERALDALATVDPNSLSVAARVGRLKLSNGDITGAREQFGRALHVPGEAAAEAQYAARALDRVLEVSEWGGRPSERLADGRLVSELTMEDLRTALKETGAAAYQIMRGGRVVEIPRPNGPGTRPAPHPDALAGMQEVQEHFAGLLVEAIKRQAPLQEWAVVDGYPLLIHSSWARSFVHANAPDRTGQRIDVTDGP